jgi:hypothetical protein
VSSLSCQPDPPSGRAWRGPMLGQAGQARWPSMVVTRAPSLLFARPLRCVAFHFHRPPIGLRLQVGGLNIQVRRTAHLRSNPLDLLSLLRSKWLSEGYYASLALVFKLAGRTQDSKFVDAQ